MKLFFMLTIAALFIGCASSRKDFKANDIKAGQAVAIGRVHIIYNDVKKNKDCAVCLNSVNGPCQKLEDDGVVFIPAPTGKTSLRRIACTDVSGQHYNISGAEFLLKEDVTYFGNIEIRWKNSGGFKASSMFGAIGAIISESSNDGTISMSVRDNDMSGLIQEYKSQTQLSSVNVNKGIILIGK